MRLFKNASNLSGEDICIAQGRPVDQAKTGVLTGSFLFTIFLGSILSIATIFAIRRPENA
jgi:hypothetical protein